MSAYTYQQMKIGVIVDGYDTSGAYVQNLLLFNDTNISENS